VLVLAAAHGPPAAVGDAAVRRHPGLARRLTLLGRRMPANLVLVPIAAAAMAGVLQTYHTVLGRDAGVAMLVLLVAFKMLEMHARRDLFVVVFLCFFLVLTNFFYSQSIATALLMLVSIVALLTTQLSFQLTGAVPPLRTRLLMGAKMLALALPLAAPASSCSRASRAAVGHAGRSRSAKQRPVRHAWRRASCRTWRSRTSRPSA
jgi:hypothetical protein